MKLLKDYEKNLKILQNSFVEIGKNNIFKKKLYKAASLCIKTLKNNGKIIFIGNGGSAADAQHLSSELVGKYLKKRKSIPSISLTTDTSAITSIANDYDYKYIFSRQIESLANKNDLLFAISTSGKSKNIIQALKVCKKRRIKSICLTKKNYPIKLNYISDVILPVPANRVDRIQEMHIFIGHIICEILEKKIS